MAQVAEARANSITRQWVQNRPRRTCDGGVVEKQVEREPYRSFFFSQSTALPMDPIRIRRF